MVVYLDVKYITSIQESQLSAGHIGTISGPVFITDGAPGLIPAQLHSSLIHSGSSHQPEVSIVADIWENVCHFIATYFT